MKTRYLIIYILIFIVLGAFICYKIASGDGSGELIAETTEINRLIVRVQENWDEISSKDNAQIEKTGTVDYAVLDSESNVLEFTRDDMSKTISAATTHYDIRFSIRSQMCLNLLGMICLKLFRLQQLITI